MSLETKALKARVTAKKKTMEADVATLEADTREKANDWIAALRVKLNGLSDAVAKKITLWLE